MPWLHKLIIRSPIGIFFLSCFAFHFNWWFLICFMVACLLTLEIGGVCADLISLLNAKSAIKLLFDPKKRNQHLDPVDLSELSSWLPQEFIDITLSNKYSPLSRKNLRVGYSLDEKFQKLNIYVRTFSAPPYDYLLKAYVNFTGTSFVFLRDFISPESHIYQRFKLYHELAHVSMFGITSLIYRYERLLISVLGILFVSVLVVPQKILIIGLIIFACNEIQKWFFYPIIFEERADSLALKFLDIDEIKEVIRLFEIQSRPTKGFYRSYESNRRILNMKFIYSKRLKNNDAKNLNIAWNNTLDVLWPVFGFLFAFAGYHVITLNPMFVVVAEIILLAMVYIYHTILFRKVAVKQAEMEHWVKYYSAISKLRTGLGFKTWDEYMIKGK